MLSAHSSRCLGDGTARQDRRGEPHLNDTAAFGNPKTEPTANLSDVNPGRAIRRQQRHRDMLAAIKGWKKSAPGSADRAYWRGLSLYEIRQFRFLYLDPERSAFERAVLRRSPILTEDGWRPEPNYWGRDEKETTA